MKEVLVRRSLEPIWNKIQSLGGDIEEKDIDLRNILEAILKAIDQALSKEVEPD